MMVQRIRGWSRRERQDPTPPGPVRRDGHIAWIVMACRSPLLGRAPWSLLVVLLFAACAGGSPASTSISEVQDEPRVEVLADEYRFIPITVSVDSEATVTLRNQGGLAHTWTVLSEPIDSEAALGDATKLAEGRVEVGQTADIDLTPLAAGRYQVVCAIPGHFSQGMVGELVVSEG